VLGGGWAPSRAEVFHARDEALALAFPPGTAVETINAFLTDEQVEAVRRLAGVEMDSRLFTYHRGTRDGEVVGYAVIDSHVVRTLPEAFLAVLAPDGEVRRVLLLAFYEPPEYRPPERWLEQFIGRRVDRGDWRIGRDLHGLSGATLTAHAMRDALRKIVVLHDVVMRPAGAR
jgi:hypothetical protein